MMDITEQNASLASAQINGEIRGCTCEKPDAELIRLRRALTTIRDHEAHLFPPGKTVSYRVAAKALEGDDETA